MRSSGIVREVGSKIHSILPGQRVVIEPTLPCWACTMCTTGRENLCENLRSSSDVATPRGGMADQFSIRADRLHAVADELDDRTAALIEPLSTPIHAAHLAGGVDGKTVVILGAGTIGLLMLAVVRHQQTGRVVVTDLLADKRDRALRLGADVVIDASAADLSGEVRAALGQSADVVFDCVSIQATVTAAVAMADKGGTVVVVGVPAGEVMVPLPVIQDHQVRVQGSATYPPVDFEDSISMLLAGAVSTKQIVTAQLPLDAASGAFELASSGHHVKVLLTSATA